ncbi:MAG: hypothetical protein IKM97_04945 [Clostridia bacterium]|nr:hypothetical protein [Clostridia bacterium]
MTKEDKEILKNCWIMTTTQRLDNENMKLKSVIEKVLNENMTSEEKSRWGYEYYIENHLYNEDLDHNIKFLADWAEILKGMGNRNYPYVYAIDRVLKELKLKTIELNNISRQDRVYTVAGTLEHISTDCYCDDEYDEDNEQNAEITD